MRTVAGVGLSEATDALEAARASARQALDRAGAERADWGLVFVTSPHRPHYAAMLAEIQKILRTESITGCSAWGVLTGTEEVEGRPAVAVLAVRSETIVATTLLAPLREDTPDEAARQIGRGLGASPFAGLLVLLPDPFAGRPDHLLEALARQAPGIEAIGAAASSDPSIDKTFQFYGRNVATRALAGLHLSGGRHLVGITQGCQPLGEPCRVTRGEGNMILQLDGRPALDVLRARLPGALADSLDRLGSHLFVGLPPDPSQEAIAPGEYLVRSLIGADADRGALAIAATIREGLPILLVLRESQAAREDLKSMLRRLGAQAAGQGVRFGLYFNCAARGTSLYGLPGIDTAYISGTFGDLPILGFFGNAEIAPLRGVNHVFTYTGVLALVTEAN
jgi:small ligand-binding sensory domain FIST